MYFQQILPHTKPNEGGGIFKKTGCDALAISYGTMHCASKGKDVRLRREIPIAIKECLMHENIFGVLVSHGSSTVPAYKADAYGHGAVPVAKQAGRVGADYLGSPAWTRRLNFGRQSKRRS